MSWTCHGTDNSSLVDALCANDIIQSKDVERAMRAVDRAAFLPKRTDAYIDAPQAIGYNATISAPHMHAYCLELLREQLRPGSSVLDVGSGSGYLCAVFAALVAGTNGGASGGTGAHGRVVGVEHVPQLVSRAASSTAAACPWAAALMDEGRLQFLEGDGREGHQPGAPYDVIHVGAAAPQVPCELVRQLRVGGRLLVPVGPPGEQQQLMVVDKGEGGKLLQRSAMSVFYIPLTERDAQLN